jgi:hypothetical protein
MNTKRDNFSTIALTLLYYDLLLYSCEECQRRKQKCNRQIPCFQCSERDTECVYPSIPAPTISTQYKRQKIISDKRGNTSSFHSLEDADCEDSSIGDDSDSEEISSNLQGQSLLKKVSSLIDDEVDKGGIH